MTCRDIMFRNNKFWDSLQAFGSDESDKMATKRPNNRQICSERREMVEKLHQQTKNYSRTVPLLGSVYPKLETMTTQPQI